MATHVLARRPSGSLYGDPIWSSAPLSDNRLNRTLGRGRGYLSGRGILGILLFNEIIPAVPVNIARFKVFGGKHASPLSGLWSCRYRGGSLCGCGPRGRTSHGGCSLSVGRILPRTCVVSGLASGTLVTIGLPVTRLSVPVLLSVSLLSVRSVALRIISLLSVRLLVSLLPVTRLSVSILLSVSLLIVRSIALLPISLLSIGLLVSLLPVTRLSVSILLSVSLLPVRRSVLLARSGVSIAVITLAECRSSGGQNQKCRSTHEDQTFHP